MNVKKRDGSIDKLQPSKFIKQIKFGVKDTDITVEDFEKRLFPNFKDGIETKHLQNILIETAEKSATLEEQDWLKVSGRLAMWDLYGQVYSNTGFNTNQWIEHITYLVEMGRYKKEILETIKLYNLKNEDIDNGPITNINMDVNEDFNVVISMVKSTKAKNLLKEDGDILEYPFLIHLTNALLLSDTKEDISLGTSFLNNLRIPGGNVGSCYIGTNINSLTGIAKSWDDISHISKEGGGIGWYVGFISSSGSKHNKVIKTSKKTKWHKILDVIAGTVDQGSSRKAAITVADDWWQIDIYDFLEMKSETAGDLRDKSFDIFPQVIFDNYLVDNALAGNDVYLFDHKELKNLTGIVVQNQIDEELYKTHLLVKALIEDGKFKHFTKVNAMKLVHDTFYKWVEIGGLYITHKDNLNLSNYIKEDTNGNRNITHCGNYCVESFSITKPSSNWEYKVVNGKKQFGKTDGLYHSCNLMSLNVSEFSFKTDEEIYDICETAVYSLTKSISLNNNPAAEADATSKYLMNIGIGTVGFPDYMAYEKVLYDTEEGRLKGMALQEKIAYFSYKASIKLAIETEPYPWFSKENYDKLFGKTTAELNNLSKLTGNNYDWEELRQEILTHGIANFYLLATAPNTSTGLRMGVGSSFLPVYSRFNYESVLDFTVPVGAKYIKDRFWYYKSRYQYNSVDIVKFTTYLQEFIDTGISMELNLSTETTNIYDLIMEILRSFQSGKLKAVYYSTTIDPKNSDEGLETPTVTTCELCKN